MSKGRYTIKKRFKKKLERMNDQQIKKKPKNFYEDKEIIYGKE